MLTDEQRALAEENINLAHYMAQRLKGHTPLEFSDLDAYCLEGLCKAALKYDPSKGFTFATFATTVIQNHVFMANRNIRRKAIYLEELLESRDGLRWEDLLSSTLRPVDDAIITSVVTNDALNIVIPELSAREKQILTLLLAEPPTTQKQISETIGLSQAQVSRILKRIKTKLEKQITG